MSRILRHISAKDLKRTHQKKLSEQKKLIAQKLKEWQEAEKERRQIEEAARPYKSNWREELNEAMTTQGMTYATTLPAEGDTTLADVTASEYIIGSGASVVGSSLVLDSNNIIGTSGNAMAETGLIDLTNFTTLKLNVSRRTVGSKEELRLFYRTEAMRSGGPDNWYLIINDLYNNQTLDLTALRVIHGTIEFQIRSYFVGADTPRDYTTWNINSFVFQRRTPITVFVALDSPEASSFVRDGDFDRLTPAQKKKKLEEQLAASKEYLDKMFGEGMPGTATQIADIQPQQSFMDIALDTIPYEEPSPGPGGYKPPGSYDPNKFYDLKTDPSQLPSPNLPDTGPGRSRVPDGTQVAAAGNPRGTGGKSAGDPDNIQWPRNKYPNKKAPPGPGYRPPTAKKKQTTMVAHHKPEGKVLSEKKRLKSPKDLVDKIPGYYDGKPSPLGFPVEEPPKMKNGYHPDLVDGKKVAKRYNRLDPISAKAMPPTGNPHIDKKVRAAAKKSK